MVDLLAPVAELLTGTVKGVSTIAVLLIGYRWLKKGAVLGFIMTMGAYFLGGLAVLSVLGIVEVNPGVLMKLLGIAADIIGSLLLLASGGDVVGLEALGELALAGGEP